MPIFEYACHDCHLEFEALVRTDTVVRCPACRGERLGKRLSVFATAPAAAPQPALAARPAPCGGCGHPDGAGGCMAH